jgi:hypothetical protein
MCSRGSAGLGIGQDEPEESTCIEEHSHRLVIIETGIQALLGRVNLPNTTIGGSHDRVKTALREIRSGAFLTLFANAA